MKANKFFIPFTYCPRCGHYILPGADKCPKCGLDLQVIES